MILRSDLNLTFGELKESIAKKDGNLCLTLKKNLFGEFCQFFWGEFYLVNWHKVLGLRRPSSPLLWKKKPKNLFLWLHLKLAFPIGKYYHQKPSFLSILIHLIEVSWSSIRYWKPNLFHCFQIKDCSNLISSEEWLKTSFRIDNNFGEAINTKKAQSYGQGPPTWKISIALWLFLIDDLPYQLRIERLAKVTVVCWSHFFNLVCK